jgi:hypothetical protein
MLCAVMNLNRGPANAGEWAMWWDETITRWHREDCWQLNR